MTTTDFGSDVSCYPSLDPTFSEITGEQCVAEAIVRRWSTPRGLCTDDPDCGEDIRLYLNRAWTLKSLFDMKTAMEREALKDERVMSCTVQLTANAQTRTITAEAWFTTADGQFSMVLEIGSVTLKILGIS